MRYFFCRFIIVIVLSGAINFVPVQITACSQSNQLFIKADIAAKDSTATMQKIAEGVYVISHDNASDEWPHGNTGVVLGDDGILVIDACYLPSRAKADIALIKSISSKPVKYLVYTHWHMDHNNGGIEYRNAFPDIEIVSERQTANFIEINSAWWDKYSTSANSPRMTDDKALEDELAKGIDTATGKPFSSDEFEKRKKVIAQRQNEKHELANLVVVKPNKVFDNELTLSLGKRKIILKDNGRANSLHDVTIYLPEEKILFTGDIAVQDPLPYVGSSYPLYWVNILQQIKDINAKMLVLGHGPVQYDYSYIDKLLQLYNTVLDKARQSLNQGISLNDFVVGVNVDELRTEVWQNTPDADWKYTVETLATRAWKNLRGQEY